MHTSQIADSLIPFPKLVTNLWFSVIVHVLTHSYFNLENEWEKREDFFFFLKIEFRVLPCEKVTLNAKRVNSGASHPPLNFATLLQNLWPTGGCASKLLWRVTPSKALRAGLMNIYTLIRCPDLSGCDRKEWWVLRSWGTHRDKGVALLMQILHST